MLVHRLERAVAALLVRGEGDGALLWDAGRRFDGVDDAGEVEGLEVESLVGRGWGYGGTAGENGVGDAVCGDLEAGAGTDAGGDDAGNALDEDVEGCVLQALWGEEC